MVEGKRNDDDHEDEDDTYGYENNTMMIGLLQPNDEYTVTELDFCSNDITIYFFGLKLVLLFYQALE
jgi:hypothetical protein